jgi:hypothetical protein
MAETDMDAAIAHGDAARAFAEALLGVQKSRELLFAQLSVQEDSGENEVFERLVERYERACRTLCKAQEMLHEAKTLDLRPLCLECERRLYDDEIKNTCPATGHQRPHRLKEPA